MKKRNHSPCSLCAGQGWKLGLTWAARAAGEGKSMRVQMRCHFIDALGHFVQCWVVGLAFAHTGRKELDPEDAPLFP